MANDILRNLRNIVEGRERREARHRLGVLVEGPEWGDAKFYGEWLLAAAKAESLWTEALEDKDFKKRVERVCVIDPPDFGIAATVMLMKLKWDTKRFVIEIDSGDDMDAALAMMFGMGFFAQRYRSYRTFQTTLYQMTLPSCVTAEKVREAVLQFTKTEDRNFVLHPERILDPMPLSDARALLHRLRAMDGFNIHDPGRA